MWSPPAESLYLFCQESLNSTSFEGRSASKQTHRRITMILYWGVDRVFGGGARQSLEASDFPSLHSCLRFKKPATYPRSFLVTWQAVKIFAWFEFNSAFWAPCCDSITTGQSVKDDDAISLNASRITREGGQNVERTWRMHRCSSVYEAQVLLNLHLTWDPWVRKFSVFLFALWVLTINDCKSD